jgi:MFS family permease
MTDTLGTTASPSAGAGAGAAAKAVLITLAAAQFVMVLDASVMNVSIATVAKDVGTTVTGIQTAITLYTLVMAAFMITGGKIGQMIGRKRAFTIGCVIYGCGSFITAISSSLGVLLLGWSFLEGIGAVLILPSIVALVAVNYGPEERPRAYGMVAAATAIAIGIGPIIGGLFTTYLSWRWVFAGEVVIVLAILGLARRIPEGPKESTVRLDLVGTALSALGLGLIVFGVLRSGVWGFVKPKPGGPEWIGLSPSIWLMLAGGVVLYLFIEWEGRVLARGSEPLLDPKILQVHVLRAGLNSFFFQYFIQGGVAFAVPLFLSVALGLSAIQTGVRFLPLSIALILAAMGIPKLFPQASPRRVVQLGFVALFAGLVIMVAALQEGAGPEITTGPMLLAGLGIGALSSQLGAIAVSSLPDEQSGVVGGLQNTITNLGISMGTALTGAIVIAALSTSFLTGVQQNSAVPQRVKSQATTQLAGGVPFISDTQLKDALDKAHVPPRATDAIVEENAQARLDGLRTALSILAFLALIGLLFSRRIPAEPPGSSTKAAPGTEPTPAAQADV